MNLRQTISICALCAASFGAFAQAAPIGYVKTLSGDAVIVGSSGEQAADVGSAVFAGDRIRTRANGSLGLTLKDNTMMAIGPDTEISVDEFAYAPASEQLRLGARIMRGTLQFVSGIIAKLRPEAVTISTPTATIGVRGTRFLVKVAE
ncbi:FecR domain-containing protein [Azoarcus olearius]|uniref:Conserved hypothetical secreted protein n=1 Tax=Azoarcus sp. (strain BH72) TaxID=418699 RepID=A1K342_AZOSB|nr:FecR family protein [Azoarcus olearius]ANQ83774.1 hypothetical protein dqs_0699 [Azoarcus olearius]CAL93247.1 conserved hypothetical secreted protein [Azoarcus olearius]